MDDKMGSSVIFNAYLKILSVGLLVLGVAELILNGLVNSSGYFSLGHLSLSTLACLNFMLCGLLLYNGLIQNPLWRHKSVFWGGLILLVLFSNLTVAHYLNLEPLSFNESLLFLTVGLGFILLHKTNKNLYRLFVVLCLFIIVVSLLSMLGFAFRVNENDPGIVSTRLPLISSIGFFCIGLALLFNNPKNETLKVMVSSHLTGRYSRAILCIGLLANLVMTYFENLGESYSLYTPDFGDTILSTAFFLIIVFLVSVNARLMYTEENRKNKMREELDYKTHYDVVTGLMNRYGFYEAISDWVADRKNGFFAIIKLDLNQFNLIYNVIGHAGGDALLVRLAEQFRHASFLKNIVIAKLGTNKFGFFVPHQKSDQEIIELVGHLLDLVKRHAYVDGQQLFLTASAGISLSPRDGVGVEELLIKADQALLVAIEKSGNAYQFYREELSVLMAGRLDMEAALNAAIDNNELQLYYQPQLNLETNKICGAEALIRWRHSEKGFISPALFVPVAEETGLLIKMGEWLFRETCRMVRDNKISVPVAVNVSAAQFNDVYPIVTIFKDIMAEYGVDATYIELEMTESILMHDTKHNLTKLNDFKQLGFKLSLDDFGTGFSSFSYINQIPNDKIKIDKSFIDPLPGDHNAAVLVKAMIDLFHQLNKKIVVEGVENKEQLAYLRSVGCDIVQGYYYSEPLPEAVFKTFVLQHQ